MSCNLSVIHNKASNVLYCLKDKGGACFKRCGLGVVHLSIIHNETRSTLSTGHVVWKEQGGSCFKAQRRVL